jgi:hypothetical protein
MIIYQHERNLFMSKEHGYGMLDIEDRGAWPHRRGNPSEDIKSGARIQEESATQHVQPDVIPGAAKVNILRTAIKMIEHPEITQHLSTDVKVGLLVTALRYATQTQPTDRARNMLLIIEPSKDLGVPAINKPLPPLTIDRSRQLARVS